MSMQSCRCVSIFSCSKVFYTPNDSEDILKLHCPRQSLNPSVCSSGFLCLCHYVTLYCMNGCPCKLTEVFGISRRCAARNNHVHVSKVKVTLAAWMLKCNCSCPDCNSLNMHGRNLNILAKLFDIWTKWSRERATPLSQMSKFHLKLQC